MQSYHFSVNVHLNNFCFYSANDAKTVRCVLVHERKTFLFEETVQTLVTTHQQRAGNSPAPSPHADILELQLFDR